MTIEERRAEILRKRLLNQRLANAKFSDYQTPMGGPRRRGRGGLLNSTLGALSSVVSNDDNDLDNISFSTTDGMKVNLQNNRAKDSTPKDRLADFSWYKGNYGGGNEDTVEQQTGIHSRAEAMQKHRDRLKLEQEDRNRENAMRSDAIGAFIEKNSAAPKLTPRAAAMQQLKDRQQAQYEESVSGNEDEVFDYPYNMEPMDDGTFPGYFPGNEDAAFDENIQHPMEPMDDGTFPGLEALNDEALLGNEDSTYDANGYLQDWRVPLMDGYTGDGEFDYTGVPLNPDNQILGEESAAFDENIQHPMEPMDDGPFDYPSTLDTSYPYVPSDDYTNEWDELTEDEQLAVLEVEKAQEWRDDNPELAEQYDAEILASQKLADEKADEEWVAANPDLAALEEELTMESNMATRHPEEDLFAGDNLQLDKDSLIYDDMVTEIADTKDAFMQLNKVDPKITEEVTNIATELEETGDQEKAEFKLSGIFDWLKDIFGVDDKSLLRAFVKYVGGRLFGLSSGKAAAFAWKGIEQDMATEAAKGADARAYQDNMDEYDKMYDAALERGDEEEARRILQKMNSLSGVEKSDAEKFDDNISYLNKKYDEAEKAGDTTKMAQIAKQLKKMEAAGISGTKADTWMGSLTMTDPNGVKVVAQAMQVDGEPLLYYDETDGTFKLPSDGGFSNAIRTVSSDESTEKFVIDGRTNLEREEYGMYNTKIPYAISISKGGLPKFDEGTVEANKAASFSLTAVKSFMQMEDILAHNDQARQEIFSLMNAFRESVANDGDASPMKGVLNKFIKRDMSPAAKLWFNNMNTLVTSKLRRETGAAYNKEELITTMNFFPNSTDYPANFAELDDKGQADAIRYLAIRMGQTGDWILSNAGGLQAYDYLEGLIGNIYRPDDSWLKLNRETMEFMDSHYNPKVTDSTVELIPTT